MPRFAPSQTAMSQRTFDGGVSFTPAMGDVGRLDFLTFASGESLNGHTLVVHECAHKLEALDGIVIGKPLLHSDT